MDQPIFEIGDEGRYSRLELIAWWNQRRLRESRVLVVGAGALGNEVLKNLALIGVGQVDLVDFDRIETSNLSRAVLFRDADAGEFKALVAAREMRRINADLRVEACAGNVLNDLGLGRVRAADVVIGCLDNREARLWLNRMCWKVNRPWIDGGIQEINGVVKVFRPPDGPCYECGMNEVDYRLIQMRYSCPLLQQSDLLQGRVPTAPTIASIIGGIQVQEALKVLHDLPAGDATATVYNGIANRMYQTRYPVRPDCLSHETYDEIEPVEMTADDTVESLLKYARTCGAEEDAELVLDRDWVASLNCLRCSRTTAVERILNLVRLNDAACGECGQTMQPRMIHRVPADSPWSQRSLRGLGIPDFDVVKVEWSQGSALYQLAAVGGERQSTPRWEVFQSASEAG